MLLANFRQILVYNWHWLSLVILLLCSVMSQKNGLIFCIEEKLTMEKCLLFLARGPIPLGALLISLCFCLFLSSRTSHFCKTHVASTTLSSRLFLPPLILSWKWLRSDWGCEERNDWETRWGTALSQVTSCCLTNDGRYPIVAGYPFNHKWGCLGLNFSSLI